MGAIMAQAASCHTCIYAHWDLALGVRMMWTGFAARPSCGNQPEFPGRMKECPLGPPCRNYRPRPPTPKGDAVKTIPLGNGFYAYVDAGDYEELNRRRWRVFNGYAGRSEKGKIVYMHRQIMQPPEGMIVDHINRNRLDNTRGNMRNITRSENQANMGKRAGTSSIYKNVVYVKDKGKWVARMVFMGLRISLGYHADEAEAARAYDRMAVALFGDIARVNFPEEWPPERRARVYAEAREKREALIAKAAQARKQKSKAGKKKGVRPPQRPQPPKKKGRKRAGR
jgi:hypothetical protein